jgi:hypothetical protein
LLEATICFHHPFQSFYIQQQPSITSTRAQSSPSRRRALFLPKSPPSNAFLSPPRFQEPTSAPKMYIHCTKTRLLGVLLSLLAIAAGATAAGEATVPGGRRFMRERSLLQSCDVCPSSSVATAACQAVSQSQVPTIRADLISRCSNVALNPARCCELYSSAQWSAYSGCAW